MFVKPPLISVIIPIFKVEDYLRICVDSVLTQSFKDYELILVDDGSPDGCPAICDGYAAGNDYIKVIHKENGGLSDARNVGISAAEGEYILFIDSDDFIMEGTFEKIVKTMDTHGKADVFFLNARRLYPDGSETLYGSQYLDKEIIYHKSRREILYHLSKIPQNHLSACLKLVKRKLMIEYGIIFTKGIYSEDVDWSIKLYLHAGTFGYCEHNHYIYRQFREGSIMTGFKEKRFDDVLFIIDKWISLASGEYKEYEDIIYHFLYHKYHDLVLMYGDKENRNRRKYKAVMKELSWLLDIYKRRETFLMKIFYKIFGLRLLSIAFNFYLKGIYKYE